ncbi:chemotaxis protein CheW [Bordetella hinzii]|uniref:chemotaxis protein CheW n=1 Tax=Bordetella hinzii TaxID=103855 RepID=UPI003F1BAFD8
MNGPSVDSSARHGRGRLYLAFRIDGDRYALDCAQVVEVLGRVPLKQLPGTPDCVAGLLDYRGHPVPVIDVSAAAGAAPAPRLTSSRLAVVHYAPDGRETPHLLGLILAGATDTLWLDPDGFEPAGLRQDGAPFLGPIIRDGLGLIQRADVGLMLGEAVRAMLYPEAS